MWYTFHLLYTLVDGEKAIRRKRTTEKQFKELFEEIDRSRNKVKDLNKFIKDIEEHEYFSEKQKNKLFAQAHFRRGNCYLDKGKRELSIGEYDKALEYDPQHSIAHNNRSIVYTELGEYDKALVGIEQALVCSPDNPNFTTNLAYCYILTSEPDKAREALARIDGMKKTAKNWGHWANVKYQFFKYALQIDLPDTEKACDKVIGNTYIVTQFNLEKIKTIAEVENHPNMGKLEEYFEKLKEE